MIPRANHCYFDDPDEPLTFVGREKDLEFMNKLWKRRSPESSIIKIANMPGIGKTELVKQFYRTYGMDNTAVLIFIDCSFLNNTLDTIDAPQDRYILTERISRIIIPQLLWYYEQQNQQVPNELLETIKDMVNSKISFSLFLDSVFNLEIFRNKKILFFFDEIQSIYGNGVKSILTPDEIQEAKLWFISNLNKKPTEHICGTHLYDLLKNYEQGIFRSLSKTIPTLLSPGKNFVFVSGTQYRLIEALEDLGSPLQGRVTDYKLTRLTKKEMREWYRLEFPEPESKQYINVWKKLGEVIIQFSGGIPRIMDIFLQYLPDKDTDHFFNQLLTDYPTYEKKYIHKPDDFLETYIMRRITKLFADYGEEPMKKLLILIAKHYIFHDYSTEEEILAYVNRISWEKHPDVSDLVQAGLLLRTNGDIETDYTIHNSYIPNRPIVLVSKYIHDLLRRKFIDDIWMEEMGIQLTPELLRILRIHPSIVGFAFEYYFATRILQLSQDRLELVIKGKSPYFSNIPDKSNIILDKLSGIASSISLDQLKLGNKMIYLLATEKAIDGLIIDDKQILLYQIKFTKVSPNLTDQFFDNFNQQVNYVREVVGETYSIHKLLFTLAEPTDRTIQQLRVNSFLICTNLVKLFGEQMINWLIDAKEDKI